MLPLSTRLLPALRRILPVAAFALLAGISAPALLAGISAPAAAEGIEPPFVEAVGHWQISGNDVYCQAAGGYQNGTRLVISLNTKFAATISIENDKWDIPKGSYEVVSWIDRVPPTTFKAEAWGGWIMWFPKVDANMINLLSYGRTLYAVVGIKTYQYDLVRSEAMLKALGRCVASRTASSNPFADTQSNPYKPAVSNPFVGM